MELPILKRPKTYYLNQIRHHYPIAELIFKHKKPVVIFGAARLGKKYLSMLQSQSIPVLAFIDNNKALQGKVIESIPIQSVRVAKRKYRNTPVLVASQLYETEICELLRRNKFKNFVPFSVLNLIKPHLFKSPEYDKIFDSVLDAKNYTKICKVYSVLQDRESKRVFYNVLMFRLTRNKKYLRQSKSRRELFSEKILALSKSEIFADCGAFDGDSVLQFYSSMSGGYRKVFSFEPDRNNFKLLKSRLHKLDPSFRSLIPVKMGVYDKTGFINFDQRGTVDSRIANKNTFSSSPSARNSASSIHLITLDKYFSNKETPTLIKMDIEGVETEALRGGQSIITKNKPKLAISAYHHATDLWEIPLLIMRLNNKYSLFFRHYSDEIVDTMCIAV